METVGVEAVVKSLSSFLGDMGKINSSLQDVRGEGTFLQRAFASVTDGILSFGESVARVAEVALGVLLRDAILAIIDGIKELVSATIDAGNEFQTLQLRLERLNLNDLKQDFQDITKADLKMEQAFDSTFTNYGAYAAQAVKDTQEQLKWLTILAAQSPYDSTDVANTFTLARSYGFASEEAKGLTENILNFAAGMGLSEVEIKRIIVNFGQMVQQGKVTQRELNDLARGAFVPVNDVLKIMQERTGLAGDEFDDFKNSTDGVNMFMNAFAELVETRFAGATEQMSQTFKAATDNVLDLVKGIFGLNAVKPVLDVLGKKASDFANAFTDDPERWDRIVAAATRIGASLGKVVEDIFDLAPSSEGLAEGLVSGLEKFTDWIEAHRGDIVGFVENFIEKIGELKDKTVEFIEQKVIPTWEKLTSWYKENKETISEFFSAVGEIAKEFFSDLMGGGKPAAEEGQGFLETLTQIMQYVIDNKEEITKWVEVLWSVFIVWQFISTILSVVVGIGISVIGFVLGLIASLAGLIGILAALANPLFVLIGVIGLLVAAWITWGDSIKQWISDIGAAWNQFWFTMQMMVTFYWSAIQLWLAAKMEQWKMDWAGAWEQFKKIVENTFDNMKLSIQNKWEAIVNAVREKIELVKSTITTINWGGIGRSIVEGIANGISNFAGVIVNAAKDAAMSAFNAAADALGIHSPSKLFFEIGANTMEGMALGIQKAAGLAATTMQGAMARVASAAVPSVTNANVYNSTANYNLTVNSGAQTEPIIQDFNMMSSLAGV